ncbi:MAG: RagB/SusD family nutrient uptake outer membrane protein, partial [Flavobacteriaceae bacterium]|nr:RagB/SusD family nutrient uptake outer membrane protein [Flavobacteriaceae bacterium]
MRIKYLIYSLAILTVGFSACDLDPQVENTFGDNATWSFPDYAEGVLMNAYAAIPNKFINYNSNFLDVATDNAVTNDFRSNIYQVATGGMSPNFNPVGNWNKAYDQFRNIHLFLENGLGDNVIYNLTDEAADQAYRDRLKGEAFFLRAWWGFQLLQEYGGKTSTGKALGYPILTATMTEQELANPTGLSRNTYEECVAQIKADIDTAMAYLPKEYRGGNNVTGITGLGRADDQVALALKSRLLLYAASPAYQDDDITEIYGMGSYSVVDRGEYERKWIEAAHAAQEALDLVGNVPGLKDKHFTSNNTPNEFIWRKYHNDREMEKLNFPPLDQGNGY